MFIQSAFGWNNYHLYQFSKSGYSSKQSIGIVQEDNDNDFFMGRKELDASQVRLSEIFQLAGQKYTYIYDFGDDWTHQITLEAIFSDTILNAELIAGKGACPPEDCGGIWGYAQLKEILSDRKHPEYKEMKQWLGLRPKQDWDADFFDLEQQQKEVRQC